MSTQRPLATVDTRGCRFSVVGHDEDLPKLLLSSIGESTQERVLFIGGGVKGLSPEAAAAMMPWMSAGLKGFAGVALSGGTAYFDKESGRLKSEIVTAIPAVLAAENHCIAIGTFPRVADFAFNRDLHYLYTDEYGTVVDDRYHHVVSIQRNASDVLGWDGDLEQRFKLFHLLENWTCVYIILNGGDVTRDEAYMALELGVPVVVARGSGREADALIAAVENDDFSLTAKEQRVRAGTDADKLALVDGIVEKCKAILKDRKQLVRVVEYGDVDSLRAAMVELNIIDGEPAS